jgi:hypothetical protein
MIARARQLPLLARPRLDHEGAGVGRRGEDRLRDPDQVVEIELGGVDLPLGAEDRGEHLLGARLPVDPGDGDHGAGDLAPAFPRHAAVGVEGVLHLEEPESLHRRGPRPDDRGGRTGITGGDQVGMTIEPFPYERHEERPLAEGTGVGRDLAESGAWNDDAEGAGDEVGAPTAHRRPTEARTIVGSSKGTFSFP